MTFTLDKFCEIRIKKVAKNYEKFRQQNFVTTLLGCVKSAKIRAGPVRVDLAPSRPRQAETPRDAFSRTHQRVRKTGGSARTGC
jgi:hypothetical protein